MTLSVYVLADGASYDSKRNFHYLYHDNGIESAIKVRKKNSTDQSNGSCYPRKLIVLQQMKNFKKWKQQSIRYGKSWIVKFLFYEKKKIFGKYVMVKRNYYKKLVKKIFLKFSFYNMFADMKL